MEDHSKPNPIKKYYIAYFDILGYRKFFEKLIKNNQQEKAGIFLTEIHNAITNVKANLSQISGVTFFKEVLKIDIDFKIKIFSDNFIICFECYERCYMERMRALYFIEIISEIQRYFILEHKLFVRGGLTIGEISFNDDYIFGNGLIEAVDIEEKTVYPRITISDSYRDFILDMPYTIEDIKKGLEIHKKIQSKEIVPQEDLDFYDGICPEMFILNSYLNLTYHCYDNSNCVSYLYKMNPFDYVKPNAVLRILDNLRSFSTDLSNKLGYSLPNISSDIDDLLAKHKVCIEEKIKEHGHYQDIDQNDQSAALQRERVLKKYVWAMKYHNDMCCKYQKMNYHIDSVANCDAVFMLLKVTIIEPQPQNISNETYNEQNDLIFEQQKQKPLADNGSVGEEAGAEVM